MCRFALYLGDEIRISTLITEPVNSIIHQSFHSYERSEPLNGDGFGLAWYPADPSERPALFKSMTPAWSNRNLTEVARVTATRCLLAHVRAATPGVRVTVLNCHPFAHEQLTFMHNGEIGGFPILRRRLLDGLSDEAFAGIEGTTDSELLFALFLDRLREADAEPGDGDGGSAERLARALEGTIASVEALRHELAPQSPSLLNLAICDGQSAVVSRYASADAPAVSLYFSAGRMYVCDRGFCRMEAIDGPPTSVIIASEPLDGGDCWIRVEAGNIVSVTPDLTVSTRPLNLPTSS